MPSKLVLWAVRQGYHYTLMSRGRAVAARVAHNHKVAGSSPVPATKTSALRKEGFCFGHVAGHESAMLKRSQVKSAIRHFARQSTLENLFSKMLLRARRMWASPCLPTGRLSLLLSEAQNRPIRGGF